MNPMLVSPLATLTDHPARKGCVRTQGLVSPLVPLAPISSPSENLRYREVQSTQPTKMPSKAGESTLVRSIE